MNKLFLIIAMLSATCAGIQAKVRLHHLIGDNMVVQADSKVNLWGWDTPGKTVTVSVSWSKARYTARAAANGKWLVKVQTPQASYKPLSITFDDGERTTISNVLAGQVWVCGGQSNMEMPVRGFGDCPVENYNQVVAEAVNTTNVRYAKVASTQSMKPLDDCNVEWRPCDPAHVGGASATGYFFGRMLHKVLNQPIGLIEANQGGTAVEGWLNEANLRKCEGEELDSASIYKKHFMARQLVWGNGTFHPILNYTVHGIIYYQGCSNVGRAPLHYAERLAMLARQWRDEFGQGELPFYFVEIAPYDYGNVNGTDAAVLRDQQFRASKLIPNSGMVSNNDGAYPDEAGQIHPRQKRKVGERLAMYALSQTYGLKGFIYKNPSFKEMTVKDGRAELTFNDTESGLYPMTGLKGFEVAGADRVFHKADAQFQWGQKIGVSSPAVKEPVAVRYCWRNFLLGNVCNQGGLPLIPFRTDNW